MLFSLHKKSLITLYFSILKPCFVLAQANMSSGIADAVQKFLSIYVFVASPNSKQLKGLEKNVFTITGQPYSKIGYIRVLLSLNIYSVAYVTVPTIDVGKTIGHGLVKNKLAACVNVIPQVTSIYEWEGKINEDSEALLMIKTRTSQVDKLTEFVRSNHPYTVCEVISLPIKNGNPPYLKWIGESVPEN